MLTVLAVLLLAAPVDESGTHVGVAAGAGMAEDFLGAHLQVRYDHLALFVGTGLPLFARSDGYNRAGVTGARWYSGLGDRFFISTQFTFWAWQDLVTVDTQGGRQILTSSRAYTVTAVAGWRWRAGGFVFDLGAGGGYYWQRGGGGGQLPIPDLTAAVGYEF